MILGILRKVVAMTTLLTLVVPATHVDALPFAKKPRLLTDRVDIRRPEPVVRDDRARPHFFHHVANVQNLIPKRAKFATATPVKGGVAFVPPRSWLAPPEFDPMTHRLLIPEPTHAFLPISRLSKAPTIPGQRMGKKRDVASSTVAAPVTGLNNYWKYETDEIPGIGSYAANVATGNLVVESSDLGFRYRDLDLNFDRVYNSLSLHDSIGSDGSPASHYGNGWTNNFDMRLAPYPGKGGTGISVYDGDGARYDYTANPSSAGSFIPPPGQHATLSADSSGIGYYWIKKDGTTYHFYRPDLASVNSSMGAYQGLLMQIIGRAVATTETLEYSFQGNAVAGAPLASITVQTDAGPNIVLTFSTVNGVQLLTDLRWPDQQTHTAYLYDSSSDLTEVEKPDDGTYETCTVLPKCIPNDYNYYAVNSNDQHLLESVESPDYVLGFLGSGNSQSPTGGCFFGFQYASNGTITDVLPIGYMNPTPNDGTNTPIYANYPYGPLEEQDDRHFAMSTGSTAVSDAYGHSTIYAYDGRGALTGQQNYTGTTTLSTSFTYDSNLNLTAELDPRGGETDYSYDGNGNLLASALPSETFEVYNASSQTYSQANHRPTTRYAYDSMNNIVAVCDPVWNHNNGGDFGQSNPCVENTSGYAALKGVRQFVLQYPSQEPFGRLYLDQAQTGYQLFYAYQTANENTTSNNNSTDYGLPTSLIGSSITQLDQSSVQHSTSFTYDQDGNILTFNPGFGPATATYSANGWVTSYTDPDHVKSTRTYNNDGTLASTQTALQAERGVATTYTYDADQNQTSETHHEGCTGSGSCTPATSRRFYDGLDRLVEDAQPFDSGDLFKNASTVGWLTRYKYDYSSVFGDKLALQNGTPITAYGGMYEVQEYLGNRQITGGSPFGSFSWQDISGYSYDAIDRPVSTYRIEDNQTDTSVNSYDSPGQLGLRSSTMRTASGGGAVEAVYSYDVAGVETSEGFSNLGNSAQTPTKAFLYDSDHRTVEEDQQTVDGYQGFGAQYGYNQDGSVAYRAELQDTAQINTSPATVSYAYYEDGNRASVSVAPNGGNWSWAFPNPLISYAYRADGALQWELPQYDTSTSVSPFKFSYSNAGRLTSRTDPVTGTAVASSNFRSSATSSLNTLNTLNVPGIGTSLTGVSVVSPPLLAALPLNISFPKIMTPTLAQTASTSPDVNAPPGGPPPSAGSVVSTVANDVTSAAVQPYFSSFCPQNYGYDSTTGLLTSMSIATCQSYNTINYDDEGNVSDFMGYYVPNSSSYEPMHIVNSFTSRGELAGQHFYDSGAASYDANWPHFSQAGANGFMYPVDEGAAAQVQSRTQFDVGTAKVEYQAQLQYPSTSNYCGAVLDDFRFSRDAFGREIGGSARSNGVVSPSCQTNYIAGSFQRTFDARDHVLSTVVSGEPPSSDESTDCNQAAAAVPLKTAGTVTNYFDVDDHPIVLGATSPAPVIHYDGDTPLFLTTATGSNNAIEVHELKFGYDAEKIYSSGYGTEENTPTQNLFVFNRDWTGNAVLSYSGNPQWTSWLPPNPYSQACVTTKAPPASANQTQALVYPDAFGAEFPAESPSSDLIEDGTDYIQGLRSFSPNSGAWASLDPGDPSIGDPQSFKQYLYDGGNPLSNHDTSGAGIVSIATLRAATQNSAGGDAFARAVFTVAGGPEILSLVDPHASNQEKLVGGATVLSFFVPPVRGAEVGMAGVRAVGDAAEAYAAAKVIPELGYRVIGTKLGLRTNRGTRYADFIAQHVKTGEIRQFEVKFNTSRYLRSQRLKDQYLATDPGGFRLTNPDPQRVDPLIINAQGSPLKTTLIRVFQSPSGLYRYETCICF